MSIKVKPRIILKGVPRDWYNAYIRCKKAADTDGYIYCKDCANFSFANSCHRVAALQVDQPYPTSLEFCLNYVSREVRHV